MIIAANWKMNLSREQALHHLTRSSQLDVHHAPGHQSVFFVPACYFGMAEEILSSAGAIGWGGQIVIRMKQALLQAILVQICCLVSGAAGR